MPSAKAGLYFGDLRENEMKLFEATPGQKILVNVNATSLCLYHNKCDGLTKLIPATFIENTGYDGTLLAWKSDEIHPPEAETFNQRERINVKAMGYSFYRRYSSDCFCEAFQETSSIANTAPSDMINDHICPSCKNNRCNKSEKTCWRCGNSL